MPRLNKNQRNCAVGRLHASYRMAQNVIARQFSSLWRRFLQFCNTLDRPCSGRPRVTSVRQDNHFRLVHLRNLFQKAS